MRGEIEPIASWFEKAACQTKCETDDWVIKRIAFPKGAESFARNGERLYEVYARPHYCGAGQCYEGYILRDAKNLTALKSGLPASTGGTKLRAADIPQLAQRKRFPQIPRAI